MWFECHEGVATDDGMQLDGLSNLQKMTTSCMTTWILTEKCLFARINLLTRCFAQCTVLNRSSCVYFQHTVCVFMIYPYGQNITVTACTNLLLHMLSVMISLAAFLLCWWIWDYLAAIQSCLTQRLYLSVGWGPVPTNLCKPSTV